MARRLLLSPAMSRTSMSSTKSSVPSSSRLVRKPTAAPRRSLRVVRGPSEAPVAERTETGSEHRSFELACLPHQAELFGVAMRICRDPDTAKDLVQETLLRAMCAWDSFQTGSN